VEIKITDAIEKALKGSRKVDVTFRKEATAEAALLIKMSVAGQVEIFLLEEVNLTVTAKEGRWENDCHRKVTVTFTDTFDQDLFISQMSSALEGIEVVD
jgi:hypothetical protein